MAAGKKRPKVEDRSETGEHEGGGVNHERMNRHRFFSDIKETVLTGRCTEPDVSRLMQDPKHKGVIRILGDGFTPATSAYLDGRYVDAEYVSSRELLLRVRGELRPGASVIARNTPILSLPDDWRAAQEAGITLTGIRPLSELPLRAAQPFTLAIEFTTVGTSVASVLELHLTFPDGQQLVQRYTVKEEESRCHRKLLEDFAAGRGGTLEISAALYDDQGHADYLERAFPVVASNPLQLYVYPQHYSAGTNKGAAEYRSGDNRYYCEGRWVVSNGNPYPVTVGPRVRCRVSDSGLGELADFTFAITPTTVPANSNRTLYVYTRHGSSSDVYDLFRHLGDAKYEFWLQTPEGDKYDWNVWVAMAQVGVTANFVGNFSWAERLKVVEIIEEYASGIYSKVDCVFTAGTPILEIPSSNADWSRYRDIRVEENKNGKCVDSDEADDLRDDWSSPGTYNDRLDIFFVESFSGDACASSLGGFSPVGGPTGKGGDDSGIVIDVKDLSILSSSWGEQILGIVIAHEVGHFLDLSHSTATNNFMKASIGTSDTSITYGQWQKMRDHGFVQRRNP
jgi:hypothetical protein